jgi:hypothetical protein
MVGMGLGHLRYFSFLTLIMSTIVSADSYVIKSGDQMSTIAKSHIVGPVWGATGSLAKLLRDNPSFAKHPNLIFPDQVLKILEEPAAPVATRAFIPAKLETEKEPEAQNESRVTPMNDSEKFTARRNIAVEREPEAAPSKIEVIPEYHFSTLHAQDLNSSALATIAT